MSGFSNSSISTASNIPGNSASVPDIVVENGVQIVNGTLSSRSYPAISVMAGVPVRWTIDAPQGNINGCNNRMLIPEYDIEYTFQTGENVIEFTPTNAGKCRCLFHRMIGEDFQRVNNPLDALVIKTASQAFYQRRSLLSLPPFNKISRLFGSEYATMY